MPKERILIVDDEKILSVHWGVVYKNIFYHLMPSISQNEFMKYAPGRLLLFNLIQWSIDNKIYKFDFTIGDEGYKRDWTKENNFLYSPKGIHIIIRSNCVENSLISFLQ